MPESRDSSPLEPGKTGIEVMPSAWWACWDCDATFATETGALVHAEREDHWLGEHRSGFQGNPATRTMHASDYGGVYVDDYPAAEAQRTARDWRVRQAGGAF